MKKFNWKLALQKRWMELMIAMLWLVSGIINLYRAIGTNEVTIWCIAICALLCCPCWVVIFYKRAKRDGC